MSGKPKIEEIKYLGTMYAKDAWGNEGAETAIKWLQNRLNEEMEKNTKLEMENFSLSVRPSKPLSLIKRGILGIFPH